MSGGSSWDWAILVVLLVSGCLLSSSTTSTQAQLSLLHLVQHSHGLALHLVHLSQSQSDRAFLQF